MSKLLLYLRTNVFRKNLIFAIIAFIGLFFLIYFGLRTYTKHGQAQEVPQLRGLHISDALRILKEADLNYQIDSIYQLDASPGMVMEQDPEPLSLVKGGRTIYLTIITQTAPEVEFPNIIEKNFIEASSIIRNLSLKIGDTIYINDIARDVILDAKFAGQSIKPGRKISKGSSITLVLGNGKGANEVEVPDLLNLSLAEAKFALEGLGLTLGQISGTITDTLRAHIIAQSPDHTSVFIPIGSPINLTLSND